MMNENYVYPPWITYPGYPPGDGFWRQGGEAWFIYVWKPFWKSLSPIEQDEYLKLWKVPYDWKQFYFDTTFQNWLESLDN